MNCQHCNRGHCRYHEGMQKFSTGLQYTKTYRVYDLKTGEVREQSFRSDKERKRYAVIEIDEKIATCTKCGYMKPSLNYFVTTRSGSANVCLCEFCRQTQFANAEELYSYIKQKLKKRYHGNDKDVLKYLI